MARRSAGELMGELRSTLAELVSLDPADVGDLEVTEAVRDAYQADSMLESFTTAMVGEADARRLFRREGASSCSAWVGAQVARPVGECREVVRRARRLSHMDLTATAFARGQVSVAHIRHLIRAHKTNAVAFGRDEALLVDHAKGLRFDDFVRAVDYWCALNDPDGVEADALDRYRSRAAHLSKTFDGTGVLDATFETVGFALFAEALARIERELWDADWADAKYRLGSDVSEADLCRTRPQRRYDALIEMARRSAAVPAGARLPRPLVTVLVDAPTLTGRICELSTGIVLTPGEVLPLLCDVDLERVVFDGASRVLDVGETQRFFVGATRRAVEVRDRRCTHHTCTAPAHRCDVDHVQRVEHGGLTIQTNGRLRCPTHHPDRRRRPPPNPDDEDDDQP
jgi:hypothetical protein